MGMGYEAKVFFKVDKNKQNNVKMRKKQPELLFLISKQLLTP